MRARSATLWLPEWEMFCSERSQSSVSHNRDDWDRVSPGLRDNNCNSDLKRDDVTGLPTLLLSGDDWNAILHRSSARIRVVFGLISTVAGAS